LRVRQKGAEGLGSEVVEEERGRGRGQTGHDHFTPKFASSRERRDMKLRRRSAMIEEYLFQFLSEYIAHPAGLILDPAGFTMTNLLGPKYGNQRRETRRTPAVSRIKPAG
jgi:hypothetical protein